jgi:CYTH domain-containing protein
VFDNSTDFKGKVKRVIDEVFALLGEPVPKEIERKYLIKMPTEQEIGKLGCISETNIIQTYLRQYNNKTERRVRQRGTKESGFTFYYTEKTEVSLGTRIEKERRISQNEYVTYLTEADTSLHQISKTRRCFIFDKRYFELDIYPFNNDYAILEIEVNDINEEIKLPPFTIVKEVTADERFKNHSLAKTLKFDLD